MSLRDFDSLKGVMHREFAGVPTSQFSVMNELSEGMNICVIGGHGKRAEHRE